MGEDSWKKDLRGCEGQREDVEVEPWFTQELGTAPRRKEFQKKRIYFYLIRIPLHCMSNVWRKDRKETEKQKDCFPQLFFVRPLEHTGMRTRY